MELRLQEREGGRKDKTSGTSKRPTTVGTGESETGEDRVRHPSTEVRETGALCRVKGGMGPSGAG